MSGHGSCSCCPNSAIIEVARLTGENTRLQFESIRLGGELTRLSNENTRLRDENSRLAVEVKRLTDAVTSTRPSPPAAPPVAPPAQPPPAAVIRKYIYMMDPAYEYTATCASSPAMFGLIVGNYHDIKTQDGGSLLGSEVSPQGHRMRDHVVILDKKIVYTDGLTFVRDFP